MIQNSFDRIVCCLDSDNWVTAMQEELESMHGNDVSSLVGLPDNFKSVGCKSIK